MKSTQTGELRQLETKHFCRDSTNAIAPRQTLHGTESMITILKRLFGQHPSAIDVGPPTGKTGNDWTEDDFSHLKSELATAGGNEFADFCIAKGNCEITGEVLDKFKEILKRYPADDEEEYDLLGVIVRQRLVAANLLPEGDPERYQYKIAQWGSSLAIHG